VVFCRTFTNGSPSQERWRRWSNEATARSNRPGTSDATQEAPSPLAVPIMYLPPLACQLASPSLVPRVQPFSAARISVRSRRPPHKQLLADMGATAVAGQGPPAVVAGRGAAGQCRLLFFIHGPSYPPPPPTVPVATYVQHRRQIGRCASYRLTRSVA
jgi:hypothetical protein